MAKGKSTGRNQLPRISSPEGIEARAERRIATSPSKVEKGGSGSYQCRKPGSRNPRKAGR